MNQQPINRILTAIFMVWIQSGIKVKDIEKALSRAISTNQGPQDLEKQLAEAVSSENYERAAQLRNEIQAIKNLKP